VRGLEDVVRAHQLTLLTLYLLTLVTLKVVAVAEICTLSKDLSMYDGTVSTTASGEPTLKSVICTPSPLPPLASPTPATLARFDMQHQQSFEPY
jgi:hypothetical protein